MRPPIRRRASLSAKVFHALLALYPAAFRDEYRRELLLIFVDQYREATSRWERARIWLRVLAGIAAEAPKEHSRMILQDLRSAWRTLRKQTLVTATIVVTLALGIGVNTAMFSLVNAVILRSLPVHDPEQLFVVRGQVPIASGNRFSGPMFDRFSEVVPEGVTLAAMSRVARVYIRTEGAIDTEPAALQLVSPGYFQVAGIPLSRGRTLPDDSDSVAAPVAIVSERYWQRRLGGDPGVIGRTIAINGASFSIIGVGPPGFAGVWLESPVDIWVPLAMQSAVKYAQNYSADGADQSRPWMSQERIWWLDLVVRTRPELTATVTGALDSRVQEFAGRLGRRVNAGVVLAPFARGFSAFRQQFETPLFALMAMAALVLLIACANVSNVLLARATGRQREMALRMSLGAGRLRLVHQLLTESALLVTLAGGAALLLARWTSDLLVRTATASGNGLLPFAASVDLRVLGVTAAIALTSVVLFAVLPAWRTTRLDLIAVLKGARGASGGSGARPARLLVIVQVALSLVLVTATGLLVRSFQNLLNVDVGFTREHLLSVAIDPRLSATSPGAMAALHQRILNNVASVPGVSSASLAMCGLLSNCRAREDGFRIEGYQAQPDEQVVFLVNAVSPNYSSTVGMRLVAGRPLNDGDRMDTPQVAVVNQTLASRYFEAGHAIGRRFGNPTPNIEIVGIVEDARVLNVRDPVVPTAFFSLNQRPIAARSLDVRVAGDPLQAIPGVRAALRQAAPDLTIERAQTIDERIDINLTQERLIMFLASGFGMVALGLAGLGLFGVLSYAVARRTSEFGIRMTLGASQSTVAWSVAREALALVMCGFALGLPFVFVGGRLASTLFFGVGPNDWSTLLASTLVLVAVGAVCSAVPALRASRVDPIVALRAE